MDEFDLLRPLATWHLALKWVVVLARLSTLSHRAAGCVGNAAAAMDTVVSSGGETLPSATASTAAPARRRHLRERAVSELYDDDDRGP